MSVDSIWDEMRQKDTVDLASIQKTKPKVKRSPKFDNTMSWMSQWNVSVAAAKTDVCQKAAPAPQLPVVAEPPLTQMDVVENIPTDSPDAFQKFLQRDVNLLAEDSWQVRLASLDKLYRVIAEHNEALSADLLAVALDELMRPLIKCIRDDSEKCRSKCLDLLTILLETAPDISFVLGYFFPTMVARMGCQDLDCINNVPEVMRPTPEQKPMEIYKFVEDSEEVRLLIARCVQVLFARLSHQQVFNYVDEAVAILRALAMDPYSEIKSVAMSTMQTFCYNNKELLLHFAPQMGRSLMCCLVHNLCKIRIEGLQTITAVLFCGIWKTNHEIMQQLVAWQDPNMVPVKAFYESVTSVNYMSYLTFDRHPSVRRFWFETIAYWLLKVPDHCDHEPHLFPYILSGLFDENDEIGMEVFFLIERLGENYEEENEKDMRDYRQYGFDQGWTYNGKVKVPFPLQGKLAWDRIAKKARGGHGPDHMGHQLALRQQLEARGEQVEEEEDLGEEIGVPDRPYAWSDLSTISVREILPRPRLGSRLFVRSHIRKFIKALFNDVCDFRECTSLNAAKLLSIVVAYSEENITEWIQPMFLALTKCFSGRAHASSNKDVVDAYDTVCWQLGAFFDPISYWEQLKPAVDDSTMLSIEYRYAQLHILAQLLKGSIYCLQSVGVEGLGRLEPVMADIVSTLCASDLIDDPLAKKPLKEVLLAAKPVLSLVGNKEIVLTALAVSATDADLKEGEFETERFDDLTLVREIEHAMGIKLEDVLKEKWWESCSFHSIRAVAYLAPLAQLEDVSFLDQTKESLRLGAYIALKASRVNRPDLGAKAMDPTIMALRGFIEGRTKFSTAATCLQVLRRLSLKSGFYGGLEYLNLMTALLEVLVGAELHKIIQKQMEAHEREKMNKASDEDFAILVSKSIRERAIEKSVTLRCLAGDIFLILFRRYHSRTPESWRSIFYSKLFEILEPPAPKIEPLFLRPTPPAVLLMGLEGILLCLNKHLPGASSLVDDAQRQVSSLKLPTQNLIAIPKADRTAEQCVICMMDINVALPADPHAPVTPLLEEDACVKIGDDFGLSAPKNFDSLDELEPEEIVVSNPAHEVARLISQSEECLKWNAVLLLYKVGIMGAKLWPQQFCITAQQWKMKNKEGRFVVAEDLLRRIA